MAKTGPRRARSKVDQSGLVCLLAPSYFPSYNTQSSLEDLYDEAMLLIIYAWGSLTLGPLELRITEIRYATKKEQSDVE